MFYPKKLEKAALTYIEATEYIFNDKVGDCVNDDVTLIFTNCWFNAAKYHIKTKELIDSIDVSNKVLSQRCEEGYQQAKRGNCILLGICLERLACLTITYYRF